MGPCIFCGTTEDIQIHHLDPEAKHTHRIWSYQDKKIRAELAGCIPLCKKCHTKFHAIMKKKPLVHGTTHGYKNYRCRCTLCTKANYYYKIGRIEYSGVVTEEMVSGWKKEAVPSVL